MTDEPAELDDVIVTGQRARGPSPFAGLQFPNTGISAPQQNQLEEEDDLPEEPTAEETQCSDAEARKQWEADAKAIKAAEEFKKAAKDRFNEPDWQNREFGALICEMPSGAIELSEIYAGDPILDAAGNAIHYALGRASVNLPATACGAGVPLGSVHSHPGVGTNIPSADDFAFSRHVASANNVDPDRLGIYIAATMQEGSNRGDFVTRYGNGDEASAAAGEAGDFINPDAQPCPGTET